MGTISNLRVVGLLLTSRGHTLAVVQYVDVNNARPTPPYTAWATAGRSSFYLVGVNVPG